LLGDWCDQHCVASQPVRRPEKLPLLPAEKPANGGLLRLRRQSPDPGLRHFLTKIAGSLRRTFEKFPFLGDGGRRLGSICTAGQGGRPKSYGSTSSSRLSSQARPKRVSGGGGLLNASPMAAYENTASGEMRRAFAASRFIVRGDATKMAQEMINSVGRSPPLRLALESQTCTSIRKALEERLAALGTQKDIAFSADIDISASARPDFTASIVWASPGGTRFVIGSSSFRSRASVPSGPDPSFPMERP
jgi:hypothetical protein